MGDTVPSAGLQLRGAPQYPRRRGLLGHEAARTPAVEAQRGAIGKLCLPDSRDSHLSLPEFSSREPNPFEYPFLLQNRTLPPSEIPSAHRSEWLVRYFSIP